MKFWRGVKPVAVIYLMKVFGDFWTGNRFLGPGFIFGIPLLVLVIGVVGFLGNSDK